MPEDDAATAALERLDASVCSSLPEGWRVHDRRPRTLAAKVGDVLFAWTRVRSRLHSGREVSRTTGACSKTPRRRAREFLWLESRGSTAGGAVQSDGRGWGRRAGRASQASPPRSVSWPASTREWSRSGRCDHSISFTPSARRS